MMLPKAKQQDQPESKTNSTSEPAIADSKHKDDDTNGDLTLSLWIIVRKIFK